MGTQPRDPAVVLTKTGPATAKAGEDITYTLNYTNGGPADAENSKITDTLPSSLRFLSASGNGTFANGVVTWNLGTVPVGASGSVTLLARVRGTTPVGTSIVNEATFTGDLVGSRRRSRSGSPSWSHSGHWRDAGRPRERPPCFPFASQTFLSP